MAKRTVKSALFRYRDRDGSRRIARFGDVIEISGAELARAEAAGVFKPEPVPAVQSSAVERALAGVATRIPEPVLVGADELPPPPHDVTADVALPDPEVPAVLEAIEQPGTGGAEPAQVVTEQVVEQRAEMKRPAKSASVPVWEEFVAAKRPDLTAEQIEAMNKDELQAAVPAEG